MRKLLAFILLCIMLIAVGITFRTPILLSFSNHLIQQDEPQKVEAMVVLSGNAFERGYEAYDLFMKGYAPKIICPGGNLQPDFLVLNDSVYESDLTKKSILRQHVADSIVITLHQGASTAEEAVAVLKYCKENHIKKIMVVTTLFHTRRAGHVYHKLFDKEGIQVIMRGAHCYMYDENHWWQNEYGMIGLNNEYMKTLYYWLKR
jgi:uncharacterized SAM-binding protein YcdF (DUF218 family)